MHNESSPATANRHRLPHQIVATAALIFTLGATQAACSGAEQPQHCAAINTEVTPDNQEDLLAWEAPAKYPQYDLQAVADKLGVTLQSVKDGAAGPIDCAPEGVEGRYLERDPANGKIITVDTIYPDSPETECLAVDALFMPDQPDEFDPSQTYQFVFGFCPRPPAAGPLTPETPTPQAPSQSPSGEGSGI